MATVTLTTPGTRLNSGDSATGWGNYNGGGQSPSSEAQNAYQGVTDVNKKITASGDRGGVDYIHGTAVDTTAAANAIWVAKIYVTDFGDVDPVFGVEVATGTSEGNHYEFNVAGSGAKIPLFLEYPPEGGYIIAAIAPAVSAWATNTIGSPSPTAIDFFAGGADMIIGGAKAENVTLSAIDVGAGLTYVGAFTNGMDDGRLFDQGDKLNGRFGFNRRVGGGLALIGRHAFGDGTTACTGTDSGARNWSDGYFGPGDAGLDIDLSVAAADLVLAATYTSDGAAHTEADTRATLVSVGTAQTCRITGIFDNWAELGLTASYIVTGVLVADTITPAGATFDGATIRTTSPVGTACIVDPTIGDYTAVGFNQSGTGHAIEFTTPGIYNIDELRFVGYDADGTNGAAVLNSSGGLVTLERLSGSTPAPTVRNTGGSTTDIPAVQALFSVVGVPAGAEIRIYDDDVGDGNDLGAPLAGTESHVGGDFGYTHSTPNNDVIVQVIHTGFLEENKPTSTGVGNNSITITLTPEGNL